MLTLWADDPYTARARAVNVAFDVDLHPVWTDGSLVALHIAEQAFAAEVEHAVAFDIERADGLAVSVAIVDVQDRFVG